MIRHQLTHLSILAQFHIVDIKSIEEISIDPFWKLIPLDEIKNLPLPRLIDRFINENLEL